MIVAFIQALIRSIPESAGIFVFALVLVALAGFSRWYFKGHRHGRDKRINDTF